MADILKEICDKKREWLEDVKKQTPLEDLRDQVQAMQLINPPRGFEKALGEKAKKKEVGLICEIKKASPSAGLIRNDFDPSALAKAYERGGATCLSILTDTPYFQGLDAHLMSARQACDLPILRKDFMLDVWQVAQARLLGADCILLIMAALTDDEALDLHHEASTYNMDVLIETHDEEEIKRALELPSGMIGINNRNLKTLDVDIETTKRLKPLVPDDRLVVCESGIKTAEDIKAMQAVDVHTFLIGESLMRQDDVERAVKALL